MKLNRHNLNTFFQFAAGLASIIGLLFVFVSDDTEKRWIAFCVLVLFLGYVAILITIAFRRYIKQQYPGGYLKLAAHSRYTCIDGNTVEFELERIIQSKLPVLLSVDHEFKWSGSQFPTQITCAPHAITDTYQSHKKTVFDSISIQLKHELLYNQVGIVPISMTIDDSDHKANTFVGHKVDVPIQIISWRVQLGSLHDRSSMPAKIMRRLISDSDTASEWELVRQVPYHGIHHCYEAQLLYPQPGYFYRMAWDRI